MEAELESGEFIQLSTKGFPKSLYRVDAKLERPDERRVVYGSSNVEREVVEFKERFLRFVLSRHELKEPKREGLSGLY